MVACDLCREPRVPALGRRTHLFFLIPGGVESRHAGYYVFNPLWYVSVGSVTYGTKIGACSVPGTRSSRSSALPGDLLTTWENWLSSGLQLRAYRFKSGRSLCSWWVPSSYLAGVRAVPRGVDSVSLQVVGGTHSSGMDSPAHLDFAAGLKWGT